MARKRTKLKKEKHYRVCWASLHYPNKVYVAGTFLAKDDREANDIFEKDYKNNQRYTGDALELFCIVQPEKTRTVAKREGSLK